MRRQPQRARASTRCHEGLACFELTDLDESIGVVRLARFWAGRDAQYGFEDIEGENDRRTTEELKQGMTEFSGE